MRNKTIEDFMNDVESMVKVTDGKEVSAVHLVSVISSLFFDGPEHKTIILKLACALILRNHIENEKMEFIRNTIEILVEQKSADFAKKEGKIQ